MDDVKEEIKEVLQVHRDRMDGIQQEMNDRDNWAETIQTIVDGLNAEEIWEDLTNKEYRITALEEEKTQQSPGGDASRARTVGVPRGEQDIEEKMLALERAVKELAKTSRDAGPKQRKPISEFKVIQNVAPLTDDKQKNVNGITSLSMRWGRWTLCTVKPSRKLCTGLIQKPVQISITDGPREEE